MIDVILIKYSELNTKLGNKRHFIRMLESNINKFLTAFKGLEVSANQDRILVKLNGNNHLKVYKAMQWTPGIHSFSFAVSAKSFDYKIITNFIIKLLKNTKSSFALDVIRADKKIKHTSIEIASKIGQKVCKITNLKVDLEKPETLVKIEIRNKGVFIYKEELQGIKGLPYKTSASTLALISAGIDSPVAAYEMIRKGVETQLVFFHYQNSNSVNALNKVKKQAKNLTKLTGKINLHIIDITKIQDEIHCTITEKYRMTVLKKIFLEMTTIVAKDKNIKSLTLGDSIGQVASQTLESMDAVSKTIDLLILRPLATKLKSEIIEIAKWLGSFKISMLKGEDCCKLFIPKAPVTKPDVNIIENEQAQLLTNKMINDAVANLKTIEFIYGE